MINSSITHSYNFNNKALNYDSGPRPDWLPSAHARWPSAGRAGLAGGSDRVGDARAERAASSSSSEVRQGAAGGGWIGLLHLNWTSDFVCLWSCACI